MSDFLILTKVQVRALAASMMPHGKVDATGAKRIAALVGTGIGYALLAALFVFYAIVIGIGFSMIGIADCVPPLAVTIGGFVGVAFAFAKTRGVLFEPQDFDQVMSMPFSKRCVVASRVSTVYASACVLSLLTCLPMLVGMMVGCGTLGITQLAVSVLVSLLAPLPPVSLAIFASLLVTLAASRFRHAGIAYILLTIVLLCAVLVGVYGWSLSVGSGDTTGLDMLASMTEPIRSAAGAISAAYPFAVLATSAVVGGALDVLLFAVASIAVPVVAVEIIQRFYVGMVSAVASRRISSGRVGATGDVMLRMPRHRSQMSSFVLKEYRTMLGIPTYAINYVFGYVFAIVVAVALSVVGIDVIFAGDLGSELGASPAEMDEIVSYVETFVPYVLAFFVAVAPTTACSVSIEGKTAWLPSSLPVKAETALGSKVVANMLMTVVAAIVSMVALLASGQLDVVQSVDVLVVMIGLGLMISCVGLSIDASNPNYGWATPNEVVKRGRGAFICSFAGIIVTLLLGVGVMVLATKAGVDVANIVSIVVGVVCGGIGYAFFKHACKRYSMVAAE